MSTELLEAEAAAWLIRSEAPGCTAQERTKLEAWLAANPRHGAAYVRLHQAWSQANLFRRLRPLDATVDENLLAGIIVPSLWVSHRPSDS